MEEGIYYEKKLLATAKRFTSAFMSLLGRWLTKAAVLNNFPFDSDLVWWVGIVSLISLTYSASLTGWLCFLSSWSHHEVAVWSFWVWLNCRCPTKTVLKAGGEKRMCAAPYHLLRRHYVHFLPEGLYKRSMGRTECAFGLMTKNKDRQGFPQKAGVGIIRSMAFSLVPIVWLTSYSSPSKNKDMLRRVSRGIYQWNVKLSELWKINWRLINYTEWIILCWKCQETTLLSLGFCYRILKFSQLTASEPFYYLLIISGLLLFNADLKSTYNIYQKNCWKIWIFLKNN